MKANKSKRNRHTGRVNAYKQRIIDKGKVHHDSKGNAYCSIQTGVRSCAPEHDFISFPDATKVPCFSTVRTPQFDRAI